MTERLPEDRFLAWTTVDDGWAVLGRRAMYVVTDNILRIPWSDIDRGAVDTEADRLDVHLVGGERVSVPLTRSRASRAFAQTFREQVQTSVVLVTEVSVPGAGTATIAVRRGDEGLFTQVSGPKNVDLADPATAEVINAALERARDAVGLD